MATNPAQYRWSSYNAYIYSKDDSLIDMGRVKQLLGMDGKIVLNEYGNVVNNCWHEITSHFPRVELDEFVIMPNHMHGIIMINSVGAGFPCPIVGFPRPNEENAKCNIIGRGDRAPTLGQMVAYFKRQMIEDESLKKMIERISSKVEV